MMAGFLFVRGVRRVINHELWQIQFVLGVVVAAGFAAVFGLVLGGGVDPLARGPLAYLTTGAVVPGWLVLQSLRVGRRSRAPVELGGEGVA